MGSHAGDSIAVGAAIGVAVAVVGGLGSGCRERTTEPSPPVPSAVAAPVSVAVAAPPPCPAEMALVEAVCVDRWEAHLAEVASGQVHSPFERLRIGVAYAARSAPRVKPQAYIHRDDAAAACENAGKRLCRAREWHRACGGSERTRFPYGAEEIEGRCNVGKAHLLRKLFGERVTLTYDSHYNSPRLNQEPGFLAETGEYTGCVNDLGLYDMVGNLHEWVADPVSTRLRREIPLEYGDHELGPRGNGVFMGGFMSSHAEHGHGCNYATTAHKPDYHDYSTGFRCCRDARP